MAETVDALLHFVKEETRKKGKKVTFSGVFKERCLESRVSRVKEVLRQAGGFDSLIATIPPFDRKAKSAWKEFVKSHLDSIKRENEQRRAVNKSARGQSGTASVVAVGAPLVEAADPSQMEVVEAPHAARPAQHGPGERRHELMAMCQELSVFQERLRTFQERLRTMPLESEEQVNCCKIALVTAEPLALSLNAFASVLAADPRLQPAKPCPNGSKVKDEMGKDGAGNGELDLCTTSEYLLGGDDLNSECSRASAGDGEVDSTTDEILGDDTDLNTSRDFELGSPILDTHLPIEGYSDSANSWSCDSLPSLWGGLRT
mmetsp:Transcript_6334/g.15962  ORF Transcript_6334/g.15962 Transcript_6334/m.15962 type:complete len:317 (+) Transcript_6334:73-1023(+)